MQESFSQHNRSLSAQLVHGILWYADVECEILRVLLINDLVADTNVLPMPQQVS